MPRLAPVCSVEETFDAAIESFWPQNRARRALAAVSGGPDSAALLALCARSRSLEKVVCAHFNHALREAESDEDERFTRGLAEKFGAEFRCERWRRLPPESLPRPDRNRQAAARRARYGFLVRVARQENCGAILTAHHARDLVETLLLNLSRGGAAGAWEGIRPSFEMEGARIGRPMLSLWPERIREYLESAGVPFRRDSSNLDRNYKRNWVRWELLPRLKEAHPSFEEELAALWEGRRGESERWRERAEAIRERGLDRGHELWLHREDLAGLPREGRFVCLQELLRELASGGVFSTWAPTRRKPLEALFALLDEGREGDIELPGQILARVKGSTITFVSGKGSKGNG